MNKKVLSPPMDVRPVAERRYAVRMLTAPMKSGLGSSQNNIVEGMQLSASRTARKRCVNGYDFPLQGMFHRHWLHRSNGTYLHPIPGGAEQSAL